MGWSFYVNDNDGKLPSPRSEWNVNPGDNYWVCDGLTTANPLNNTVEAIKMGSLWPYTQNVELYHCPVQPKEFPRSYEINYVMGGDNWGGLNYFTKHFKITQPGERLLFICNITYLRTDMHRTAVFYPIEYPDGNQIEWLGHGISYIYSAMKESHEGGTNLSYADLHIEQWRWKDPRTSKWVWGKISAYDASIDNVDLMKVSKMLNIK